MAVPAGLSEAKFRRAGRHAISGARVGEIFLGTAVKNLPAGDFAV